MQRHLTLGVNVDKRNYKLHKDSVRFAKRSQKLLCSLAVDLIRRDMGSTKRRSGCRSPAHAQRPIQTARSLAALRVRGPCPLLAISGEQGSAKTVLSKMLKDAA